MTRGNRYFRGSMAAFAPWMCRQGYDSEKPRPQLFLGEHFDPERPSWALVPFEPAHRFELDLVDSFAGLNVRWVVAFADGIGDFAERDGLIGANFDRGDR